MVFRKPYAFLIKNFKKIHIVLLILCGFIYYKTMQLDSFVSEFISYLTYDSYLEPITKYTSPLFYLMAVLVIVITGSLVILLRRKEKTWKLYLIPFLDYLLLIVMFFLIQQFFTAYEGSTSTTTIRAYQNFLLLLRIPQYITFLILGVRILGLDLRKFNFSSDKEFLELDQDDREEFEVSINFDKHALLRTIKKIQRVLGYFYEEHRYITNVLFTVIIVIIIGNIFYYFGVEHKTIKEKQTLNANGYLIKINESYFTNKDMAGNKLEANSNFVILNLTVQNNGSKRAFDAENFHLVNQNHDYSQSGSTYTNSFKDLGNPYPTRKLSNGEVVTFALIFKVSNKLPSDRFVLYYQQYKNGKTAYLRKIKIKLEDVSNINNDNTEKKIGQKLVIERPNKGKESFTLESAEFKDQINYNIESCDANFDCRITEEQKQASSGRKIIEIPFISNDYEGQELIDFSSKYGKIKYIDSEGMTKEINVENALKNKEYLGKYLYIDVPIEIENSNNITLIYTVRNQKYNYKIR